MKAVRKDFFREIKNTPGRFLSIFFIVALGVAFFSGIRSAKNDMYYTADAYYDRANLADLKVVSNYGITKEEVESLKSLKGIEKAQGAYFGDYLTTNEDSQKVIRIHSLTKGMNELYIVEGRLPEKSGECVIDKSLGYQIGDEISLKAGKDGEIKNTLNTDKLKVVGIGESAFYIGFLRGNTNIGTGNINGFCAVTEDTFNMKVYTEVYLTLKDAKKETAYTKGYDELVKNQIKEVKSKTKLLGRERQEDLKEEALEEVGKARQNLDEKSEEARKKLELGKTALLEGKQTLAESQRALQEAKEALDKKQEEVDSGFIEYDAAAQKLEAGKAAYEEGKKTYQAKLLEYESGRKDEEELKAGIAKLEENISGLREQVAILAETNPESEEIKVLTSQLDNLEEQYQENSERASVVRKELEAGKTQLEAAKVTLSQTEEELKANEDKLATTKDTLVSGQTAIDEGRRQWTANAKELEKATEELVVNEQELLKGEKTLEEEMEEGEDKITQAKEKAQEIGTPKWEVEDRSTFPDYLGFKDNANRIGKVGKVFPAIFFLVAALVSLTTMTRLVEEQRTQIGTFKALGYTRFSIAMKYIGYGLIASLSGAVLGALVGEKIFPYIIIHAYGMMYKGMDTIRIPYQWSLALYAQGIAVGSILIATLISAGRELRETPASLMRPPAPKKGKRVLLEYVPFIWKRLSFLWKSTIRNLFRYKKRFFMTVFGIGTCMGLLLTGFGIRDSVFDITGIQYSDLQKYQGQGIYQENINENEEKEINKFLSTNKQIKSFVPIYFKKTKVLGKEDKSLGQNVYIEVPKTGKNLSDFLIFRDRSSHKNYKLDNNGVIVTEKLAKELGIERGDKITLKEGNKSVRVQNICENYMAHYIYMTQELYKETYGKEPAYNGVLFNTTSSKDEKIEEVGEKLIDQEGIISVSYAKDMKRQMDDMIGSLNMVIVVLIISAGLLAFVVLYNLNIVNIEERKRELATLKVLGFYDREVSAYVYRENIILTFVGALAGIGFGVGLHQFVIQTLEVEMVMFGRSINKPSYLYSILLTIGFSVIVNLVMFFKLKKIDMVTSLKSHE